MKGYISLAIILTIFLLGGCKKQPAVIKPCNLGKGPCIITMSGMKITFYTHPAPPVVMKETEFIIKFSPEAGYRRISLELTMPGMYMGHNRVILTSNDGHLYYGRGTIPICPAGGTLWRATLKLTEDMEVAFEFNVVN